jgi:hypothetical protein
MATNGNSGGTRSPELADRLRISEHGDGFAYRPGHVIMRGNDEQLERNRLIVRDRMRVRHPKSKDPEFDSNDLSHRHGLITRRLTGVKDELAEIEQLRAEGFDVQPDHVLFAHARGCEGGCGPHPADAFQLLHHAGNGSLAANPFMANPFMANPFRANPFKANPFRANPFMANPFKANGTPTSTAQPAAGREFASPASDGSRRCPRILVLDTGLACDGQRPELLPSPQIDALEVPDDADFADVEITGAGDVKYPADGYLDPVAGHGTFIAGLIEQLVPGCTIKARRVVEPLGDATESDVVAAIDFAVGLEDDERPDIISMSFGGHLSEGSFALRDSVAAAHAAGVVLVASAGNDGTCLPNYPAAFDDVISVGALGPDGPAPWTNFGPWVDACAPGTDLVSCFFADFDGSLPKINSVDPDRFRGWACWSGTSFAAPMVVAALVREMLSAPCTASEAVDRVIHAPRLFRLPCLGTVVNI